MKPFGLAKKQLRTFSDPLLEYLPASFAPEAVADSEYEDLESLAQLADQNVVNERIARLGVALPPELMSERLLFNDGSRAVVSGLRFLNLDLKFPFVALKANFRVNEPETTRLLKSLVMKVYGDSDPLGFTVWEQPGLDLGQSELWSVVVAGETDVAELPLPAGLAIEWSSSVESIFKTLQDEHLEWERENPRLARFIELQPRTSLEASAARGQLMTISDADGVGGLIAAESSPLFGLEALAIKELFLTKRLRYRGLGKILESQFLAKLKTDFDIVWGHIHRENEASLRTALALGRMPLQQEYFFSLSSD